MPWPGAITQIPKQKSIFPENLLQYSDFPLSLRAYFRCAGATPARNRKPTLLEAPTGLWPRQTIGICLEKMALPRVIAHLRNSAQGRSFDRRHIVHSTV
jgi:hypothetical protein